ncbi:MAG: alpha/beta fold hydrolase [Actinomycetota bacterium]
MRLHVVRAGHGSPPIVFIHGLGTSGSSWQPLMDRLAPEHQVLAVDLLGHGKSPAPADPDEYTRDRALDDVDQLLAQLGEPAVLVGHSLGGYLSLAHAATRPGVAKGVVVINTGPGFRDPDKREAWNERSRRNSHRVAIPEVATNLNLQHDSVVMDLLAEMAVPTLVLVGDQDRPEFLAAGRHLERKRHALGGLAADFTHAEQMKVGRHGSRVTAA